MKISELKKAFEDKKQLKFKITTPDGFNYYEKDVVCYFEIKKHDKLNRLMIDIPWGGLTFYITDEDLLTDILPLEDDQNNKVIIKRG